MKIINRTQISRLIVALTLIALIAWLDQAVVAGPSPSSPALAIWEGPWHISTNSNQGAFTPVIKKAPNGLLVIMYNHAVASGNNRPYYSQSMNDGKSWSIPLPVHTQGTDALHQVRLEFDANNVGHAIWRDGAGRLFYARQNQWGTGAATTIVNTGQLIYNPNIAIAPNGTLHVVWSQGATLGALNIYHASSPDGQSWTVSPPLASDSQTSSSPAVAVTQNGTVHVAWEESVHVPGVGFPRAINYKKRVGNTWDATPKILTQALGNNAWRPFLVAEGNNLHLAFTREVSLNEQYPYYMMHNGSSWSPYVDASNGRPVDVNSESPFFLLPVMAPCNGNIYLYYHGALQAGVSEQLLGTNKKSGWRQRDVVTDGTRRNVNPSLICDNGTLHMAFEEILVAEANHQIYYAMGWGNVIFLPVVAR
jgi:hypothetical protein